MSVKHILELRHILTFHPLSFSPDNVSNGKWPKIGFTGVFSCHPLQSNAIAGYSNAAITRQVCDLFTYLRHPYHLTYVDLVRCRLLPSCQIKKPTRTGTGHRVIRTQSEVKLVATLMRVKKSSSLSPLSLMFHEPFCFFLPQV